LIAAFSVRTTGFTARTEGKEMSDILGSKPEGYEIRNVSEQYQTREDLEKALNESKKLEVQLLTIVSTIPTVAWFSLPDPSRRLWRKTNKLLDRPMVSKQVNTQRKAGAPLCTKCARMQRFHAIGDSFEREADSPVCWKR
jgi:hypothetical protein